MTRVCALGVLAAVMSCAPPPERSPDAREAAQRFLDRIDSLHLDGLPSPGQLQSLGSELEPSLVLAFRRAAAAQSTFVAAHPTEKPPLIEGSLFSSLFEGPTGHRIGPIEARHDTARVTIDYIRAEPGTLDTLRWTDVLVLLRRGGRFVVSDLEYQADWGFKPGPSLRAVLRTEDDQ